MEQTLTLSILISMAGCFVGLAGWLSGRDKKIATESKWQGSISAQLDSIAADVSGINKNVDTLEEKVNCHDSRIKGLETDMQNIKAGR